MKLFASLCLAGVAVAISGDNLKHVNANLPADELALAQIMSNVYNEV